MFGCECGEEDCGTCGPHIEANRQRDVKLKTKKPRGPFWTTKQGVKMAIRDMETSHIQNCLRHLEKRTRQVKAEISYPTFQGEMAQMHAEHEWEAAMDADVRDVFPIYIKLEEELERRERRELKKRGKSVQAKV